MKRTITKEFQWDCAHRLHDKMLSDEENLKIFGKCNNMHGHTYKMLITVSQEENGLTDGMVINFVDLKKIVNELVVERFDHKVLNEDILYYNKLTTCELQIEDIWNLLVDILDSIGLTLEEIKLYETPTSYATLTR